MAFVFENVPEADWELYNSFKLKSYDGKRQLSAGKYSMWTVDRERSIYFINLGGGASEVPETYALIWHGKKIIIYVDVKSMVQGGSHRQLHWDIRRIIAPKSLASKKDEMICLIEEIASFDIDEDKLVIDNIKDPTYIDEVIEC